MIRNVQKNDYDKGFFELLQQLTNSPKPPTNILSDNDEVYIIEDVFTHKIIASGKLLIEQKYTHNLGKVGHIEEVVVDSNYRGLGFGELVVNHMIQRASKEGCYKVILNCTPGLVGYYQKCGLQQTGVQMSIYF